VHCFFVAGQQLKNGPSFSIRTQNYFDKMIFNMSDMVKKMFLRKSSLSVLGASPSRILLLNIEVPLNYNTNRMAASGLLRFAPYLLILPIIVFHGTFPITLTFSL
jgi:hypothetical protein